MDMIGRFFQHAAQSFFLSKSVNSLVAFKDDYPEAEVCLLYRGKERIFHKRVLCLPCEEFLKNLVPGKTIQF